MKQKLFNIIALWTVVTLLPIVLLLSILQIYAFNKDFYLNEFEKHNIPAITKIQLGDLENITEKVISYLKDEDDDLNLKVPINGNIEEVFGEREKLHMVDVKVLFMNGFTIRNTALFLVGVAIVFLLRCSKREFYKSLILSSISSLVFMFLLFILIKIDFHKYFTYFHEIFFANDLWLLNPETDVLIQMLPLEFFINISIAVIGTFFGMMVTIGGIAFRLFRVYKV